MDKSNESDNAHLEFCRLLTWNPSWPSTIASVTVTSIASPMAILLNAVLIIAVINKEKLQSICNILLASMAVADVLIGAVAQPLFFAAGIFHLQNDYEKVCTLVLAGFFSMYLQSASIYHLTVISCERYIAIKKGINYKFIVTKSRLKTCVIVMWVLTALAVVPSVLYVAGLINKSSRTVANACVFTVPLSICLLATAYFYVKIYLESRKKNDNDVTHVTAQVARAKMEKKIAKTAFLLAVALLASFAPTFILIFLTYLFGFNNRDTYLWSVVFNQLNSCASPILYFYRSRRFRNTVLQMLNLGGLQTNAIAPKAGRPKEKPTGGTNVSGNKEAPQNSTGTTTQWKRTNAKSNSWGATMFAGIHGKLGQETARPKSAPMNQEDRATWKGGVCSFKRASKETELITVETLDLEHRK